MGAALERLVGRLALTPILTALKSIDDEGLEHFSSQ